MVEFGDGLPDGGLIQKWLLVDQAGHERRGANLMDPARQAFGIFSTSRNGYRMPET